MVNPLKVSFNTLAIILNGRNKFKINKFSESLDIVEATPKACLPKKDKKK